MTATETIEVLSGSGTWNTPANLTGDLIVECWGGGGGGGGGNAGFAGDGGGGGGYARATVTSPVSSYSYSIGSGGAGGGAGADGTDGGLTTFGSVCAGDGGTGGNQGSSGLGGNSGGFSGNVGDVTIQGGDGADGGSGESGVGGGGGASATSTDSIVGTGGSGSTGGVSDGPGGDGGDGGASDNPGNDGEIAGGGGGGGGERDGGPTEDGGAGADGQIKLTYTLDTTAPTPSPPYFASVPSGVSSTSITMTSVTVTDSESSVEYYFDAVTGDCGGDIGTGGTDSGWQSSATYVNTGLEVGKCYAYTVTARDTASNYTATSTASSTYTVNTASVPGKLDYTTKTATTITIYNNVGDNSAASTDYSIYASSTDANWDGYYVTSSGATTTSQTWITDTNIDGTQLTGLATSTQYQFDVVTRVTSNSTTSATTSSYIKTAPNNNASTTLLSSGSGSWTVPDGVAEVMIQCWGAGGGGGERLGNNGAGGGGGAFAKVDSYSVTPGGSESYSVGTGGFGQGSSPGATSTFATTICAATGGETGILASEGLGGSAASSLGDWSYSGGDGYRGIFQQGGGGGSGATSTTNGLSATDPNGASAAFGPGGDGGDGGIDSGQNPTVGTVAGGGGGGADIGTGGRNGADGQILLTYWPDTTAPTPNPYFSSVPTTTDTNSMDMTSVTVTDDEGSTPVNYYFEQVTGDCSTDEGTGGTDSGWQSSASYSDTGLDPNQCYAYTVTAKDSLDNVTATSTASSSYTRAAVPGAVSFVDGNTTDTSIEIVNDANGNPTSDPVTTFAVQVSATSPTDATWDDQYVNGSGNPSASEVWLTDAQIDNLTVTGLTQSTSYTFQVKARNGDNVETSFSSTAASSTLSGSDSTAPTPNPYFSSVPTTTDANSMDMTSVTVTDGEGSTPVNYYFTATTGSCGSDLGTGGTDSGWQSSASYSDTGLDPNQCYAYTVTAKDSLDNVTATSTASSSYTRAAVPGAVEFSSVTQSSIVILNDENSNPASNPVTTFVVQVTATNPVDSTWDGKYVDAAGDPSDTEVWLTDAQLDGLTLNSITANITYAFRAKARNEDGEETTLSGMSAAFTGLRLPGGVVIY